MKKQRIRNTSNCCKFRKVREMNITDLGGHSGCKILLYESEENEVFVRKIAADKEYNDRLHSQAEKQRRYESNKLKTPKILQDGYIDGLYYFDMEYVQGITLAEYMNRIEIGKVRSTAERIIESIVPTEVDTTEVDETIFIDKISDLENKLKCKKNATINEAIEILKDHSWSNFVCSPCHGDLTFENIIVKDNQLYLIDFLDSFYDCWILDISTLLQDSQVLWSYRYEKEVNINTLIRLIVFRDVLMESLVQNVGDKAVEVYYALLLKLIRIYPYVTDVTTYDFLNKKTASIISIIKKEHVK